VLAGSSQYRFKANWKLMVENSIDNYHFDPLHETYKQYIGTSNKRLGEARAGLKEERLGFAHPKGHGGFSMWPSRAARALALAAETWSAEECAEIDRVRGKLFTRFGEQRGLLMAEQMRSILIFPNLLFQDSGTGFRVRQIEPVSPELTEVRQWELAPREEPLLLRRRRLEGARAFLGPGGFATPDDVEAVESCQLGYRATEVEWNDISRGGQSPITKDTDEHQIRNFWREWQAQLDAPRETFALGAAS
jgi:p-cumate 2,3-dioxygenase alpha subunit